MILKRTLGIFATKTENPQSQYKYHQYEEDVMLDGFVSPICLPSNRIRILMNNLSVEEMADKCHVATKEMQLLIDQPSFEPTFTQLMTISAAFKVSAFWLLGYHTTRARNYPSDDRAILNAISQRNGAEETLNNIKEKGTYGAFLQRIAQKRVNKYNVKIANVALHIVASQHIPLNEADIMMCIGQPVYLESADGTTEWGIIRSDGAIITADSQFKLEDLGNTYQVFLTPKRQ